ncbi:hypothetical protein CMI47_12960 [Candidatus Pacearchaeota archaeon]|nr:hypothetical protein [Candidatus Pacearchaeota archaeon]|tara:strand:+ start:36 stop:251 length:216 start_codon:yes stop_codon:yes gene_type:complete
MNIVYLGNLNESDIKVGMKLVSRLGTHGEITHLEDTRGGLDISILWKNGNRSQVWHLEEYTNPRIRVILED